MELINYDNDQRQRFPENLRRFRTKKGLSMNKLSQQLGWAHNIIASWELGERMPSQYAVEDLCAFFGVTETDLFGSPVKLRTFAYYRRGKFVASGTLQEIADQTKLKVESLRSLLCNSKRFNKTTRTYMIELEDDKRYKLKFKQSFTIDELNLKGIGWLLESPLVEVEQVEE
ncbi:helix-turn-helix transcriptional regulator [Streptococcus parasanguinis]|uniref:helix-turn-helix domain-containing protein n=1 Tax=Streptococcus parasanguinis TaxID=1318 RepID=UPI0039C448F3